VLSDWKKRRLLEDENREEVKHPIEASPPENQMDMPNTEGAFLLSPKFHKISKYGIFGNFVSKGGDQVRPPDLPFSVIAALFIIFPSALILFFT